MGGVEGDERWALVTGASGGIGAAVAAALAAAGAHLVLHGRCAARLEPVAEAVRAAGREATTVTADLADARDTEALARALAAHRPGLDVVVHNAGVFADSAVAAMDDDHWRRCFAVHVDAPMAITRALAPGMIARGRGGAVVFVASTAGLEADGPWAAYTASKHAAVGLMRAVARELAAHGVRANAVAPGWVDTPMTARYAGDAAASLAADNALGRPLRPVDVAELVVFLAGERSRHVCGQVVPIGVSPVGADPRAPGAGRSC